MLQEHSVEVIETCLTYKFVLHHSGSKFTDHFIFLSDIFFKLKHKVKFLTLHDT